MSEQRDSFNRMDRGGEMEGIMSGMRRTIILGGWKGSLGAKAREDERGRVLAFFNNQSQGQGKWGKHVKKGSILFYDLDEKKKDNNSQKDNANYNVCSRERAIWLVFQREGCNKAKSMPDYPGSCTDKWT